MSAKAFRAAVLIREDIKIQEAEVKLADSLLYDLLAGLKLARSVKDRARGYEGTILQLVVDESRVADVMNLGRQLSAARATLLTIQANLPTKEMVGRAEERAVATRRYLDKLRKELIEAEARESSGREA